MSTQIKLTLLGDLTNVQVGDELRIEGVVTVYSVTAPLIEDSTWDKRKFLTGYKHIEAYGNEMKFTPV